MTAFVRCSRCSATLILPWHFDAGLCHACLKAAMLDPNSMTPEAFLRGVLDIAAESMDSETYQDSMTKLELILLAIYPQPAQTYTATSSTPHTGVIHA